MQFAKRVSFLLVMFFCYFSVFSTFAFSAEPSTEYCASWIFETPSNYLTGDLLKVDISTSNILFDLDTSPTVATPGALLTTSIDPTTLWGSTLPASSAIDVFTVTKSLDDPNTPLISELDIWLISSPPDLIFTVLNGYYFEAEMQGYASHFIPANPPGNQVVIEYYTLTMRGWLPWNTTVTPSDFAYCGLHEDTPCQKACTADYEFCCVNCTPPYPVCYAQCMEEYASCLKKCA